MNGDHTDLKRAVREKLESKGIIHELKARIRAEVFQTVEDKSFRMPDETPEVFLACQLIKEFLDNFNLSNTSAVFVEELGRPDADIDREFISNELGFYIPNTSPANGKTVPLLISLIEVLQRQKSDRQAVERESAR